MFDPLSRRSYVPPILELKTDAPIPIYLNAASPPVASPHQSSHRDISRSPARRATGPTRDLFHFAPLWHREPLPLLLESPGLNRRCAGKSYRAPDRRPELSR